MPNEADCTYFKFVWYLSPGSEDLLYDILDDYGRDDVRVGPNKVEFSDPMSEEEFEDIWDALNENGLKVQQCYLAD